MLERHPAMEVDADAAPIEMRQWDGSLLRRSELFRLRPGVDPDAVDFPTGYAEAARDSWARFRRSGATRSCPPGRRFQVCLPTADVERVHVREPALARRLHAGLRARRCSGRSTRSWPPSPHAISASSGTSARKCWCSRPTSPVPPGRLQGRGSSPCSARLGAAVPADVELGYHLCYGSPADQHLVMPATRRSSPRSATRSSPRSPGRSTSSICRCRASATTPRTSLRSAICACRERTRLYLGLIHWTMPRATAAASTPPRRVVRRLRRSPANAAGAVASPRDSRACSRATAARSITSWPEHPGDRHHDRHHAGPRVAHVLLPAPAPALRRLGQRGEAAAPAAPRRARPLPQLGLDRGRAPPGLARHRARPARPRRQPVVGGRQLHDGRLRLRPRPAHPPAAAGARSPSSPTRWAATSRSATPGSIRRPSPRWSPSRAWGRRRARWPRGARRPSPSGWTSGSASSAAWPAACRGATPRSRTPSAACRRRTRTSPPSRRATSPCTASTRTRTAPTAGSSTTTCARCRPTTWPAATSQLLWSRITCPTLLLYGKESRSGNPAEDGRVEPFQHATVTGIDARRPLAAPRPPRRVPEGPPPVPRLTPHPALSPEGRGRKENPLPRRRRGQGEGWSTGPAAR